jgi:ADP-ribosylglycohydrolase
LAAVASAIPDAPFRQDWPWVEPDDLVGIEFASTADWQAPVRPAPDAAQRVRTAFLARVAGCMLGKPLELGLGRAELEAGLRASGSWPLDDYVPEAALDAFPERQGQWRELVRERITHVAPDDDLNYTVLAMLALEEHGRDFTHHDLAALWRLHLPVAATFGPERARLATLALAGTLEQIGLADVTVPMPLPGGDLCGALIRADAYGYACPGDPATAARLAHRDATMTHHRTGVYGAMWVAASIAEVLAGASPVEAAASALGYVPVRSRFHAAVSHALAVVADAADWSNANDAVVARYPEFGHCRILQEVGTLVVTYRFARDVGDGICLQVMQGNDTDSFGATAGSVLGATFGPEGLDDRWLAPFRDTIHVALALFEPPGLRDLADRMAGLVARAG